MIRHRLKVLGYFTVDEAPFEILDIQLHDGRVWLNSRGLHMGIGERIPGPGTLCVYGADSSLVFTMDGYEIGWPAVDGWVYIQAPIMLAPDGQMMMGDHPQAPPWLGTQ